MELFGPVEVVGVKYVQNTYTQIQIVTQMRSPKHNRRLPLFNTLKCMAKRNVKMNVSNQREAQHISSSVFI